MKFIKNISGSEIVLMGAPIEHNEYKQIPPTEVIAWTTNRKVIDAINDGVVLIASSNDGLNDFATPAEAFAFLAVYECSPNDAQDLLEDDVTPA